MYCVHVYCVLGVPMPIFGLVSTLVINSTTTSVYYCITCCLSLRCAYCCLDQLIRGYNLYVIFPQRMNLTVFII